MAEAMHNSVEANGVTAAQAIGDLTEKVLVMGTDPTTGEHVVDAKSIFDIFGNRRSTSAVGMLSTPIESLTYNMRHQNRGKCVILNHKRFDLSTQLNERRGTDNDRAALQAVFAALGFEVLIYNDASCKDVLTILGSIAKEDHSKNDCLVVCILTHGEQGVLWARDEKYLTDSVFEFFKGDKCPTLAGKPKMFFLQACQGDKLDSGVTLHGPRDVTDAGGNQVRIPALADFLIVYSTHPGYYAWRNTTQGSWFIQALSAVLNQYYTELDLVTMLTLVNRKVAYDYESNVPNDPEFHQKKQIPCITSMLTRMVYFVPK